ncbi:LysM peptidoglycan-binding domain-containing protein [Salegentibacter echinorum]|nr:LysM peptidoglycan-binding domain-containing protein [Salegentibacter echinorum]
MKKLLIFCFLFQLLSFSATAQEYKYHTVRAGETVYSIAKDYQISEEAIYKYNPDAKESLDISSKLVIPLSAKKQPKEVAKQEEGAQFITHKVKRKETLYQLSKKYDVEVDQIKRFNKQLYAKELQIGEEILIPQKKESHETAVRPEASNGKVTSQQETKTREHIVIPKETKYGIARKYGLTVKELEELNPKVEVLQPGVMLRVGTDVLDEPVIITNKDFEFYEVKPKETLFGLSRRFEVSQDSLVNLNPALEKGLKIGMVLKVPDKGEGQGNLETDETEEFSDKEEEESAKIKVVLSEHLSNFKPKELVVMLPYGTNKIAGDSLSNYEDAILDNRVTRISLDFYKGVQMAVDKATSYGISTKLRTYDTRQSVQHASNIINTADFKNVDAVIGPLLQDPTEAVASKLQSSGVPVISPLSNREMRPYRNLFQSRPTDEVLASAMIEYLRENAIDKNVIIIADPSHNQIKNRLNRILPSARVLMPSDGYIGDAEIAKTLSETSENWVILESTSVGLLSSATSALNRLTRSHDIKLFTTNKNNAYEGDIVDNEHLGRLNMHYPSVDREFVSTGPEGFAKEYEEEFGMLPNQYVSRGYDLTLDVLLRLASAQDLYESFERFKGYTEYEENKFHYIPKPSGGFYNDAVYIMAIDKELNLNVANDIESKIQREFKD